MNGLPRAITLQHETARPPWIIRVIFNQYGLRQSLDNITYPDLVRGEAPPFSRWQAVSDGAWRTACECRQTGAIDPSAAQPFPFAGKLFERFRAAPGGAAAGDPSGLAGGHRSW